MTQQQDIKSFDELSQKYSTWIIKYCSASFGSPLFFVWYTDADENKTDRLLSFKTGDIFASNSLTNLKQTILYEFNNLIVFKNLNSWLYHFNDFELIESYTYDILLTVKSIENGSLDTTIIEDFANFINLYSDYINQDDRNRHLQVYIDNGLVKEIWNYYYQFIFWPRVNNEENFKASNRPQLIIDTKELLLELKDVVTSFEAHIKTTK